MSDRWGKNGLGFLYAALPTLGPECRFTVAFQTRFRGALNAYF